MKSYSKQPITLLLCCLSLLLFFPALPAFAADAPKRVQQVKAGVTTKNSINLSWQKQKNISGYQIYRSNAYDGKYQRVMNIDPTVNAFCNRNLQSGTEYYYKVRAYSSFGTKIRYGKFSKILTAHTQTPAQTAVPTTEVNVRTHAGVNHPVIASIGPKTKVKILCATRNKAGTPWSRVQYSADGRTINGYIRTSLLQKSTDTSAGSGNTGTVTAFSLFVRKKADPKSAIVVTLGRGQKVTVLSRKKSSTGTIWCYIRVNKNGRTYKGYAAKKYIKMKS